MKSMRDAFGEVLLSLAEQRDDFVVLDADVAGGTGVLPFREAYPERFIQCGIAEQNMVSMAAGLSTTGVIPIVTCYAVFASLRAIEQARNSVAYPQFNVKIIASHLGLDVGPDGPSHQALEDLAVFRSIPNFTVISPADPVELAQALPAILNHDGPVYLRTGRSPLPTILPEEHRFEIGRGSILREGTDATIVAVGVMVHRALRAAELLAQQGISCRVVNMPSIKPIDAELLIDSAQRTGALVTAEDHNIMGGLGSAVAEVLVENCPVPMLRHGIADCFAESGDPEELATKYRLQPEDLAVSVRQVLQRKNGE